MIPTPYLRIDASTVRRNIERLASYAREHGIGVRPHTKTHKSLRLARLQLEAGAIGLTVAKAGEGEVMAQACHDLLLAYPAVDPARTERVAALAREVTVRVAIDSTMAAESLNMMAQRAHSTVGILVDIDVGMGRTGLQSAEDALSLAQFIDRLPGLRLDGIMIYPGHVWSPPDEQAAALGRVAEKVQETIDLWHRSGFKAGIVSGGSTPTAYQSHLIPQVTEIRPGTYIFNDMNTVRGGFCTLEDCAAAIRTTVVSDAVPGQIVMDAGSKTLTNDRCIPVPDSGYGYVVEYPGAKITALSEEHGQVNVSCCPHTPRIGERITVIPNHICPCVNLHDTVYWREGNDQEPVKVDTRGMLS